MPQTNSGLTRSWNNFLNAFRLAMDSIRAHKLRSFLTLLGVIIGVASVIMVGAAIEGLGVYAEQSTAKAFGSESFMVAQIAATGRLSRREYFEKIKRNKPIRTADARFLEAFAGDRVLYSPYRKHISDVKRDNLICEDSSILGAAADMADIRDIGVVDGRFFTEQEDRSRAFVAVIGDTVRTTLFPGDASPLNQIVRIEGIEFTVIGVQERLGSAFGRDLDNSIYIPVTAFNRMYGPGNGFALFGRPRPGSGLDLEGALDETRVALRTRFHARPGQTGQFRHAHARRHPRLHRPDSRHDGRHRGAGHLHFAGGGRHRDHEHHAGERHRADPRNRHPQSGGRAARRCHDADPDRSGGAGEHGRRHGRRRGRAGHGAARARSSNSRCTSPRATWCSRWWSRASRAWSPAGIRPRARPNSIRWWPCVRSNS